MDTHKLRITVSNMKNANSRKQLDEIKNTVLQNLSNIKSPPGGQMAAIPPQHQLVGGCPARSAGSACDVHVTLFAVTAVAV